jgi:GxxExxY protein
MRGKGSIFLKIRDRRSAQILRLRRLSGSGSGRKPGGADRAVLFTMIRPYSEIEGLTGRIIRDAIEVHRVLGPGLLESVYQECLLAEMKGSALAVRREVRLPIVYKSRTLTSHLTVDLLVEDQVIVELKSVERMTAVHQKRLRRTPSQNGSP